MATDAERNQGLGAYSSPGVDPKVAVPAYTPAGSNPLVTFKTVDVAPPSNLYITRDDRVSMQANTLRVGGDTVTFRFRMLRTDGIIVTNEYTLFPLAGGASVFQFQTLTEGFLLSAAAFGANTTLRGQTFVRALIMRIGPGTTQAAAMLFADYVTSGSLATWPYGRSIHPTEGPGNVRVITGTAPALGAEISESVPTNTRWRLISFFFTLNTSAAVSNREPRLTFASGGSTPSLSPNSQAQPASVTFRYQGIPGASFFSDNLGGSNTSVTLTLPTDNRLIAANAIQTSTLGLIASDQYAAPTYQVEEWLDQI